LQPDQHVKNDARARILLVEDSDLVRETTVEFLQELGFAVIAVDSAEAAVTTLEAERFDILFTDISLPGMSGVHLVRHARERAPDQRCVISSGYGADLDRHTFGSGVVVLAKPYDLAALERTLDGLLGS
jgi:CheY-like chemotaxis protein